MRKLVLLALFITFDLSADVLDRLDDLCDEYDYYVSSGIRRGAWEIKKEIFYLQKRYGVRGYCEDGYFVENRRFRSNRFPPLLRFRNPPMEHDGVFGGFSIIIR